MTRLLTLDDLLSREAFAAARAAHERELLANKQLRRVAVGPWMTLLFENRVTVRWQVHEMCRVEGITNPRAITHELDTYNALLPSPDELSATLLVDVPEPEARDRLLRQLVGLHRHLHLSFEGAGEAPARFDEAQFGEERVSSVQFVRFPLTAEQIGVLSDLGRSVEVVVDHPACPARAPLPSTTRAALFDDLRTA